MADKEATLLLRIKQTGADALGVVSAGFSKIIDYAKWAGIALAGFAVYSIKQFMDAEEQVNSLNQAMINNGIYSKRLAQDYRNLAEAVSEKTRYDNDEVVGMMAHLQMFIGQEKVTKELTQATLDFAAAKGMDLKSAADAVGKSIGTETNVLRRYGVELREGTSATTKMWEALNQLNQKFSGQAEAMGKGLGSIARAKNSFNDISKIIGKALSPVIIALSETFITLAKKVTGSEEKIINFPKRLAIAFINAYGFVSFVCEGIFFQMNQMTKAVTGLFGIIGSAVKENFTKYVGDLKKILGPELMSVISSEAPKAVEKVKQTLSDLYNNSDSIKKAKEMELAVIKFFDEQRVKSEQTVQDDKDKAHKAGIEQYKLNEQEKKDWEAGLNEAKRIEEDANKAAWEQHQLEIETAKWDQKILMAQRDTDRIALIEAKKVALTKSTNDKIAALDKKAHETKLALLQEQIGYISASMNNLVEATGGQNQALLALSKAAGIAEVIINAQIAASRAEALPWGAALVPIIYAGMAAKIATISGLKLAEGGIVRARPGGIQATIGEGGQDEAVIPLDKAGNIGGNNITINVYGGMLGDKSTAHELAVAIDRELLSLRRNNESVAFTTRL